MKGGIVMKKVFKIENLDCAVCASKMEEGISKIDGVENVSVSFLTQKIRLNADENKIDEIIEKMVKVCKRVEPDCKIEL